MERVGCYTTARVRGGRIERLERHAGRLRRDAALMGLPLPARASVEQAAIAAAGAAFGRGDGIVRIEWSRSGSNDGSASAEPPRLEVTTRALGADPSVWRARTAATLHPGPRPRAAAKSVSVLAYDAARAEAVAAGVDECLLYDAVGRLVEGGRTNLVVVTEAGAIVTPALRLGAVAGLGLEIVREATPEIGESETLDRRAVETARELIAMNAVRGAVAIVELDGRPVGNGQPGEWARRMRGLFGRR